MLKVVRHFHLAFKGMPSAEVYDVLMEQLVQAVNGYDPDYKNKVKRVTEVIDNELSRRKEFTVADVERHLGFSCDRHIRLLERMGFLCRIKEEEGKAAESIPTGRLPLAAFLKPLTAETGLSQPDWPWNSDGPLNGATMTSRT